MKKFFTFLLLGLVAGLSGQAKPIDPATARQVGRNFLSRQTGIVAPASELQLAYRVGDDGQTATAPALGTATYFYVFNTPDGHGFVLVAGDDVVTPVLGYSDQSAFVTTNLAPQVAKWLEGYRSQIRGLLAQQTPATADIAAAWQLLLAGQPLAGRTATVAPLVQTRWNQSPYYNDLCPYDTPGGGRSVSGCVATAMAQVMKFWNYPATGAGFHSYNSAQFGTLSANFGGTTYQWTAMPNAVNSTNNAVATLMYHAGVGVDMGYSAHSSNAYVISAASNGVNCAEYALKTYFGYRTTMQGLQRSAYSDAQWLNLVKTELNASRPIIYAGFGNGGGHCFVADGYDANDFVHFNWGWAGQFDGYFSINALNPAGVGTGGGNGGFNSGHQMIVGIQPLTTGGGTTIPATGSIALYNTVAPSATTLLYGQAFSVTTNIVNTGSANFAGDYTAAVFDTGNNLVDYVETKTGFTLLAGNHYVNNLTFANTGLFSMLPGTYRIGIFYRPTGGNWILVADRNGYTNLPTVTVVNPALLQLRTAIVPSPAVFTQGQPGSANLSIYNGTITTFVGQYAVNLYRLDGAFVQTIGTYTESNGLPPNYFYQAPYLTFSAPTITAAPGTYLLAVVDVPSGSTAAQLIGTGTFQNPTRVTVQAAALAPDTYEVNNTPAQARNLPITFGGNTATRNTIGSNCHVTTDVDYYALALPTGYYYTLNARLHDAYSSANGQTYSLDALWSYSTNGGATWSSTYDDVTPGPVVVNGGTLLLKIAPFFAGDIGTYLFDLTMTRTAGTAATASAANAAAIAAYPVPAREVLTLDLRQSEAAVSGLQLQNLTGQTVYRAGAVPRHAEWPIPVRDLAEGLYLLRLETSQGVVTKKISIAH